MDLQVTDNAAAERYEARLDGQLAGYLEYQVTQRLVVFTHTEVDPAFEGHGVGGALVRSALDDIRARGLHVLALCPFASAWIDAHPGYQDLLSTAPAQGEE